MTYIELLDALKNTVTVAFEVPVSGDENFTPDSDQGEFSYAFCQNLKYTENKPSVNITYYVRGVVDLGTEKKLLDSHIAVMPKTYSLMRNGLPTQKTLTLSIVDVAEVEKLKSLGVSLEPSTRDNMYTVDTTTLDSGANAVQPLDSAQLATKEFELYSLSSEQKYLNSIETKPESTISPEQKEFLKSRGISGGYYSNPNYVQPVYDGITFDTKLSSLSSIPKVSDVVGAVEAGKKLTPSMAVMARALGKNYRAPSLDNMLLSSKIQRLRYEIGLAKATGILNGTKFDPIEMDFGFEKPTSVKFVITGV